MPPTDSDNRLLLERLADGELSGAELDEAQHLAATDPAAAEYLLALDELKHLVALPLDEAASNADFTGLFERLTTQLDATPRSATMDALVVAWADGQLQDAAERARVSAYVDSHPDVREGFEAVRELGELVRAPIEFAADRVDFQALARRIDRAVDNEIDARRPAAAPPASLWGRFVVLAREHRAVFASVATAAAVFLVMLPLTGERGPQTETVQIHNHYYELPIAETVGHRFEGVQKGFNATFAAGDQGEDIAPVVWITPPDTAVLEKADDGSDEGDRRDAETPL